MKIKKYKNIIKIIAFSLILIMVFQKTLYIFNYKDTGGGGGWNRFYNLPKDAVDVVFFGNSHAHCTIDHKTLWNEYGIKGFTMTAGSQTINSTYYFVEEMIKRLHPKVIAVEVYSGIMDLDYGERTVYRNALGMRMGKTYVSFAKYFQEKKGESTSWLHGMLLKLPIVHSRYRELEKEDFVDNEPFMLGYRGSFGVEPWEEPVLLADSEVENIPEENELFLRKIIEKTREEGIELLLWEAPYALSEEAQRKMNYIAQIAKEENIDFINFNRDYEKYDIDFSRDFRDRNHLNNYGAPKVTGFIAQYLQQEMNVPNRYGESDSEMWEANALYLQNKELSHTLYEAKDIKTYLSILSTIEDKYTFLTLTGYYDALGDVYLEELRNIGLTEEQYRQGGFYVIKNNQVVESREGKDYAMCFSLSAGEACVTSKVTLDENQEEIENKSFIFNSKNYEEVDNGINILVYDDSINQVIDYATTDIFLGIDIRRENVDK